MSFTGRLGIPGSKLGYIALGTSYLPGGPNPFDFGAHQLTANQVRVYYNRVLTDTALDANNYTLTSLAPPGTAIIPGIDGVGWFDDGHTSVILYLDKALTSGTDYSLQIVNVIATDGSIVPPGAKNFTANVVDYPIAIGCWQSKRDAVDILFDRPVAADSTLATFEIRDASLPGPGTPMTQIAWAGENIPDTTLRIQLPAGMPAADAYEIDYFNVQDESLNSLDTAVPLTLALRSSPPYSYAELRKLQIIDAFITDISNDFITTGNLRVYFNGPVQDSRNIFNWALWQSGVHLRIDGDSEVFSPDPFDIPSLITLANEWKARFNEHLTRNLVHSADDTVNQVTAPNAFDIVSVYTLINDEQLKYIAHLEQNHVHLYVDTLHNDHSYSAVSSYAHARSVMISMRNKFNDHVLLDEYPMNFSTQYDMSGVAAYCEFGAASPPYDNVPYYTTSPYTFFSDLHVTMDSYVPTIRIEATVTSEDSGSVTNPADYTGGIVARAAGAPAELLYSRVYPEQTVTIGFDKEVLLLGGNSLEILNSNGQHALSRPRPFTSLPVCVWALNNAVRGYYYHRGFPVAPIAHQQQDITNTVSVGDYSGSDLADAITKANSFKTKMNSHMSNDIYHYIADFELINVPDATDEESLIVLIQDIQQKLIGHFARVGPHKNSTQRVISAPRNDLLILDQNLMVDQENYDIVGQIQSYYHDNVHGNYSDELVSIALGSNHYNTIDVNSSFIGLATRPSVASAIPKLGLVIYGDDLKFESDTVEVFFSKPMDRGSIDTTNLPITGGSISALEVKWADQYRASIQIQNMENVAYIVTANNLNDVAGNLVF